VIRAFDAFSLPLLRWFDPEAALLDFWPSGYFAKAGALNKTGFHRRGKRCKATLEVRWERRYGRSA